MAETMPSVGRMNIDGVPATGPNGVSICMGSVY